MLKVQSLASAHVNESISASEHVMNISGLSFNALPPVHLPFRFFLTAPLFALACVVILIVYGDSLFISRWHPAMLALTHGFTLGIVSMVMMGALLQILPVVAGISVPKVEKIASLSHGFMVLGTVLLMLAFIYPRTEIFMLSLLCLTLAFILFIGALIWAFMPTLTAVFHQGATLTAIRFSVLLLMVTVVLGLLFLANRAGLVSLPLSQSFTDMHALLGGFGWVGLLIIGVSFQVVPMFHVAPNFPNIITRYLSWVIVVVLVIMSMFLWLAGPFKLFIALLLLLNSAYVLLVINRLKQRKRKVADVSIRYWFLASISLLLLTLSFIVSELFSFNWFETKKVLLFSSLFIYAYLLSVIQGLLIKILPFLSYTHLQQRCLVNFAAMQLLPHMHQFISKQQAGFLWWLHVMSILLLVLVMLSPSYYIFFTIALAVEFIWLGYLMIKTVGLYNKTVSKIDALEQSL